MEKLNELENQLKLLKAQLNNEEAEELEKSFKKLMAGAAIGASLMGSPDKANATSGDLHGALDKVKQSWEDKKHKDSSIELSGAHGDDGHGHGSYKINIGPYRVQGKHFSTGQVSNHKTSILKDKKAIANGADPDGKHYETAKKMHNFLRETGNTLNDAAPGQFDYHKQYKNKVKKSREEFVEDLKEILEKSGYKGYTATDNARRKKNNIEDAGVDGDVKAMPHQKKWGKNPPKAQAAKDAAIARKNKKQPVKVVTDPEQIKQMMAETNVKKKDEITTYNDHGQWKLNKFEKSNAIGDSQYQYMNPERIDFGANDQWAPKKKKS